MPGVFPALAYEVEEGPWEGRGWDSSRASLSASQLGHFLPCPVSPWPAAVRYMHEAAGSGSPRGRTCCQQPPYGKGTGPPAARAASLLPLGPEERRPPALSSLCFNFRPTPPLPLTGPQTQKVPCDPFPCCPLWHPDFSSVLRDTEGKGGSAQPAPSLVLAPHSQAPWPSWPPGLHGFFSNSDDHLLKNIELFDKLSLRFNGRVLFIKDVIGDEICCWSFYGQGRKLAEVCCTSIVYATEKKQTKVGGFPLRGWGRDTPQRSPRCALHHRELALCFPQTHMMVLGKDEASSGSSGIGSRMLRSGHLGGGGC